MRTMNRWEQPFRGATTLQEQINRVFGDVRGTCGRGVELDPLGSGRRHLRDRK